MNNVDNWLEEEL